MYEPPFSISSKTLNDALGLVETLCDCARVDQRVRREMNIRSVHASLSIEGNNLSLENVRDVIDGRSVYGRTRDVIEVENTWECYGMFDELDPRDPRDLLRVHGVMMRDLVRGAGNYREDEVCVCAGDDIVHRGTPSSMVGRRMDDLFGWLSETDLHPVIASSVFHYVFEDIHPFLDGNGRTGRFWQSLILSKWNGSFREIPFETVIHRRRREYYASFPESDERGECGPFVDFMTSVLRESASEWRNGKRNLRDVILDDISEGLYVNATREARRTGVSKPTVDRVIRGLKEDGAIVREGSQKTGRWVVCRKGV